MKLQYGTGICVIPDAALRVSGTDRTDLLVLMHLAADPALLAAPSVDTLAKRVGCQACKIRAALSLWQEAGILTETGETELPAAAETESDGPDFANRPMYTGEELAELCESDSGALRRLAEECQRICGKIFTPTEMGKVVALSEYLGLSHEHILLLFTWCASREKASVSYIEKTAYNLYDEGIRTAEQFEAYLRRKEEQSRREQYYRALFGIGERALTAAEKDAFRRWQGEWGMEDALIERAFTVMAEHTGSYKFSYLNAVLRRWNESGYRTVAEMEAGESKNKTAGKASASGNAKQDAGSFSTDDFIALALRRSYGQD